MKVYIGLLFGLIVVFMACFKPELDTPNLHEEYNNTLEEAFEILSNSPFKDLQALTLEDLEAYKDLQSKTLEDSLATQGQHYCISRKVDEGQKIYYVENSLLVLNFLSVYGYKGPSYWDTNEDSKVNTIDLLNVLSAYELQVQVEPNFALYTIYENLGEGNTWLDYEGEENIAFGWLHRTPYDEAIGDDFWSYNLYTFTFDEVREDSTVFYEYLRP